MFDLVIVADWSAAQGRKPEPGEDRCWLAWGSASDRSEPLYCPTRMEAAVHVQELIEEHPEARILFGIDAAIGLPVSDEGEPVLPIGREWIAMLAGMLTDDRSGNNNRFEVAADLNRAIRERTGAAHGPFWGRPRELKLHDLPEKRPSNTGLRKLRSGEVATRRFSKTKPKSPWQLTGAGSVGSQALMAAPLIHTLLTGETTRDRVVLWPFEQPENPASDAVVIAEVYPSLYRAIAPNYWYRDARQVCDTRDAILDDLPTSLTVDHPMAAIEGWIFGVPADAVGDDDVSPDRPERAGGTDTDRFSDEEEGQDRFAEAQSGPA